MSQKALQIDGARLTLHLDAPAWQGHRTAALEDIAFGSAAAGQALIEQACRAAAEAGCTAVIGPMNGDTWHAYRVVTESDGSPPFPMEPVSGPHDLTAFITCGFAPISTYVSTRSALDAAIGDGAPARVEGVTIRPWDGQNAEALIGQLFAMSSRRFAANAFYKPITRNAFLDLYRPLMGRLDPRLIFFAISGTGAIVGFLFGYPHASDPATVILKTYASGVRGVGYALADAFHRAARDMGRQTVIHALMHEDNLSLTRSRLHQAVVFRRYALMGRVLA